MSWVAAAAVGGAVVTGYMGQQASEDAAAQQTNAAGNSIAAQNRQLALTRQDNAPFLASGTAANTRLSQLLGLPGSEQQAARDWARRTVAPQIRAQMEQLGKPLPADWNPDDATLDSWVKSYGPTNDQIGFNPADTGSLTKKFSSADLQGDPVYQSGLQFGLDEGTKGINARALQSGGYDSGATLKALTRFANDYGSTKANESFNRFNATNDSTYNKLAGVSGAGQTATSQVGAAGVNAANNISNDITGAGNARAAGIVGGANAWGTTAGNVNSALNGYQNNQILQQLLKRNGSSTTYTPPAYGE